MYTLKTLEKSQVELTFTIQPKEYEHEMLEAAGRISERAAIKGFRPGKAPYAVVKEHVGEIRIMEEALEHIAQHAFFDAIKAEKLDTVGMPQISVEKMAPGNELVFKAVVALLPKVTLPDLTTIKVEKKKAEAGEKEIDEVLHNLRKMQTKETATAKKAAKEDKVVVDMDMFVDKVPMEGGQAKDYHVYLAEDHYIPSFAEKLLGAEKGETKEFALQFPAEHYQKQFAGKNVDFKVQVKEVYELTYPDLDDEFAKKLGQESMAKLRALLSENMLKEAEEKEGQRQEIAILEELIEKSTFGEIPQILVDSEKRKMFFELKHDLEHRGATIEQYLKDAKKTEEQIFNDFTEQGTKRAKAALVSRQLAVENDIKVDAKELADEVELIKKTYGDDKTVEESLKHREVMDTIASTIQNRKVMQLLKEKILK